MHHRRRDGNKTNQAGFSSLKAQNLAAWNKLAIMQYLTVGLPGGCSPNRAMRPVTLPLLDPISQIVSELETIQEWVVIPEGLLPNYPAVSGSGLASLLAVCVCACVGLVCEDFFSHF